MPNVLKPMGGYMSVPAQQLVGLLLDNNWTVTNSVSRGAAGTGGNFSYGYLVTNVISGQSGFLKALDFSSALRSQDPARMLQAMTTAYNYERDLLELTKAKGMSRVASSIESGTVNVDPGSPIGNVQYLIFEKADDDVRGYQATIGFDTAWILRCLHQITIGISQLNSAGIAHQDIKPSNVLVFNRLSTKVSDLGRAVLSDGTSPYESLAIAGDTGYAPLELLYGYCAADWSKHRIGCDLYQLGSMFVFLCTNVTMNALLVTHLPTSLHPMVWQGGFDSALPYLQAAFADAMDDFRSRLPVEIREELLEVVTQLCNPDPLQRGHPKNRKGAANPYSLERYISRLDLLARRAEKGLVGRLS